MRVGLEMCWQGGQRWLRMLWEHAARHCGRSGSCRACSTIKTCNRNDSNRTQTEWPRPEKQTVIKVSKKACSVKCRPQHDVLSRVSHSSSVCVRLQHYFAFSAFSPYKYIVYPSGRPRFCSARNSIMCGPLTPCRAAIKRLLVCTKYHILQRTSKISTA